MNHLHRFLLVLVLILSAAPNLYAQKDSLSKGGMNYELKGITVKGKIPPIVQSRDTAIINPAAYHTPEGAYLKDLVKRIPGLEYDEKTGKLTFNDKTIREINVNGKPFFSNNTKVPIENLPLKFISKLKIYKKQSDEEKALGISTGKSYYVLDLQTKKELNKTLMSSAVSGYGTFNKKQLEVHSDFFETGGNNYSLHATSGNQYITDLSKGSITNNVAMNITRQLNKKLLLSGNLQYNRYKSGNESSTYQKQYLQESNNYSISYNKSHQDARSINSYANVNWDINSKTQLVINANYNHGKSVSASEGQNATIKTPMPHLNLQQPFTAFNQLPDSLKVNHDRSISASSSRDNSYSVSANFIRHLNSKGTTLSLNLQNSYNSNRAQETNENLTTYYQLRNASGMDSLFTQNLLRRTPVTNNNWTMGMTMVQPLNKKLKLQLSYTFQNNTSRNTNRTSGIPFGKDQYEYVDSLSGYSFSRTNNHDIGLLLNYASDVWNIYLNADLLPGKRSLSRDLYGEKTDTLSHITDFRTSLHVERTKNNRTLSFEYSTNSSQPDLASLVPLIDNSDPLNVSRGNPNLKPTYSHNWLFSYNAFTKGIAFTMGGNLIQNSVTQATSYNPATGGRETYPVNVNGNWNGNLAARWWKTVGDFNLIVMSSGSYNHSVNLLSETKGMQRNITQNIFTMNSLRTGYTPSWGGITLTESYTYNFTINSLQQKGNFTHTLASGLNAFMDLPFGLQLQSDFMYTFRTGDNIPQKEKNQTMWNFSATQRFLKDKQLELTFTWHDILNHSRMYFRTSSSSGFYESYSPQIRSYIMLTLKYRFQKM